LIILGMDEELEMPETKVLAIASHVRAFTGLHDDS
jgi:hypothetical protein